jgi:hypothetical protein
MKFFFVLVVFFIFSKTNAQVIFENKLARNYPKIINIIEYSYFESGYNQVDSFMKFSYYIKLKDLNSFPVKKVGQMIEYYKGGNLKNIGYWNKQNDTFSIDSNKIIVFVNTSSEVSLIQSYTKINTDYDKVNGGSTYKVSEIQNWHLSLNENGKIFSETINNIRISYFEKFMFFEKIKDNKIIETWKIDKY